MDVKGAPGKTHTGSRAFLAASAILVGILGVLFWRIFDPDYVVFSNDGPFGGMVAEHNRMPWILTGIWAELNWLGNPGLSPAPTVTTALRLITSPLVFAKVWAPFSVLFLG